MGWIMSVGCATHWKTKTQMMHLRHCPKNSSNDSEQAHALPRRSIICVDVCCTFVAHALPRRSIICVDVYCLLHVSGNLGQVLGLSAVVVDAKMGHKYVVFESILLKEHNCITRLAQKGSYSIA